MNHCCMVDTHGCQGEVASPTGVHVPPPELMTSFHNHTSKDVRSRRNDTEERPFGRRWTTSRNSPYQKIVSSYETEPAARVEVEGEEAKAKNHKRKQWRTSATAHDQITSETSSAVESEHEDDRGNVQEEGQPAQRTLRRRSTTSHPPEMTSESPNITTINPKKRRRPSSTSTTTTLAPQTMSDSLYQYFRPLEQDVPQDDIIPFLDFGRKLSPVIPTPSGANSIESKTIVTKLRPREHIDEKESNSSDEEVLQEDMDLTVVKKAIERNSVPRGKLRVQTSGISDFYRKRVPTQLRTTENLISTSDSSTASSVSGGKSVGVLKKGHRHHVHNTEGTRSEDKFPLKQAADLEIVGTPKDVEVFVEKRKHLSSRPIQRSSALKQETHTSPLTAESSLVKTVIKEVPEEVSGESEASENVTTSVPNVSRLNAPNNTRNQNPSSTTKMEISSITNSPTTKTSRNSNMQESVNPKILSTAVVTSVSVQEPLTDLKHENTTELPSSSSLNGTKDDRIVSELPIDNNPPTIKDTEMRSYISTKNSSNVPVNTPDPKVLSQKNTTVPVISRDIYKQRSPSRILIHLPRQLARVNSTQNKTLISNQTISDLAIMPTKNNSNGSPIPDGRNETIQTEVLTTPSTISSTTNEQSFLSNESLSTEPPKLSPTLISSQPTLKLEPSQNSTKPPNFKPISIAVTTETSKEDVRPNADPTKDRKVTEHSPPESDLDEVKSDKSQDAFPVNPEPASSSEAPAETESYDVVYPAEDGEDQFPILFTTPPPVVDTRPESEYAVVEEQKNSSTSRPPEVTHWVKTGEVNKEVEVVYPDSMGLGTYLLAALGVLPVILGALIGARFILAHNRKKVLDESEYSSEYNRSPLSGSTSSPLPTKLPRIPTHVSWSEREPEKTPLPATSPPTPASRWEFPREKLRLQTLLGQGNFGQVWKAEADDISGHEGLTRLVAVKTVKESANVREREDLLRELGIMQELGSHPNVVTLLGCCTEKEPIYLVMEYVMYGKLLSFLRDHRTRAHYYNFSDATDALTSRDLTVFGYCVARGMDYLSNKSIIHRDMAARNVLVDHNKLCKIADFGMSRNVRDTGQIYEQRQSKGALPIRWMAPESLHFSLFTHKTDVWSFGILMWEIVTLGSTPYATMGAREVMRRVRDGYRLDRPSHCRPELFRVISRCWHSEPSKRPTFAELKVELGALLSDPELHGSFVDLDSFADEMRRDTLHRHH
ncbi:mucin-2-like [Macrosteles quadrilineatus]|uniref:mucin-2-like n=1 Tax=Macrosteles quadrilineatus TaxID=74068 RepID=UPI0023E3198E|nr:mucin-2-like [Macrosteles quadrilineatus]